MTASSDKQKASLSVDIASTMFVVIHVLQGMGLLFVLLTVVPHYEKLFADFDTELPVITQAVIRLSRTAVKFWYLLIAIGAAALAFDYLMLQTLRRVAGVFAQLLWGIFWLLIPVAVAALIFVALAVPLRKMTEALQ